MKDDERTNGEMSRQWLKDLRMESIRKEFAYPEMKWSKQIMFT